MTAVRDCGSLHLTVAGAASLPCSSLPGSRPINCSTAQRDILKQGQHSL